VRELREKQGAAYDQIWYQPETKEIWVADNGPPRDEPWILVKKAYSSTLQALGQLANFLPGPTNALIGGPSPLAATLAGGLLGGGLGYGAGWLGEQFLPYEQFRPGHLRKTLAALGAGLGTTPGLWWGTISQRENPDKGWKSWLSNWPNPQIDKSGSYLAEAHRDLHAYLPPPSARFRKAALQDTGIDNLDKVPMIPRGPFDYMVAMDPRTPPGIRAATTGLVDAAAYRRGDGGWVSPADVARIAMGAGAGYASGMLVGKTLGVLAGLRPQAQQELQRMGTWAGILTSVVPLAFAR
jgi:hypothetical protein